MPDAQTSSTTTRTRPETADLRERKNQSKLTDREWDRLVSAMKCLKDKKGGKNWDWYDKTHETHVNDAHGGHHFLPWHRRFILEFENSLREFEPNVTLPYWNWVVDREIPKPFRAKLFGWMDVHRAVTRIGRELPSREDMEKVMAKPRFEPFWNALEDIHGQVHVWVGGDMGDIDDSPKDPLFFLHHAFVDKLWSDWQAKTGTYDEPHPDETLDPWGVTIGSVLRTRQVGYRYV